MRGGIVPGGIVFVPDSSAVSMYGRASDPGMTPYSPRVRQNPDVIPTANQYPASGVGVPTPCGTVSTQGMIVFGPSSLDLLIDDVRRCFE